MGKRLGKVSFDTCMVALPGPFESLNSYCIDLLLSLPANSNPRGGPPTVILAFTQHHGQFQQLARHADLRLRPRRRRAVALGIATCRACGTVWTEPGRLLPAPARGGVAELQKALGDAADPEELAGVFAAADRADIDALVPGGGTR